MSTVVIAAHIGVSQASLFKRFGTKQDLMLAALSPPPSPAWFARLEAGPDDRPIRDQLMELALGGLEFFGELVPCISVLTSAGIDLHCMLGQTKTPPPVRGHRAMVGWFTAAVRSGRLRADDTGSVAMSFLGALQSRAFMRHHVGRGISTSMSMSDDQTYAAQLVDTYLDGLGTEHAG